MRLAHGVDRIFCTFAPSSIALYNAATFIKFKDTHAVFQNARFGQ